MTTAGRVWLVALLTGPLAGALVGSAMLTDWTDSSWQWRSVAWIVLGLAVPLACALIHTRQLGILAVTLLVGATTYPAFRHLVAGPSVATTTINGIDCHLYSRRNIYCIEDRLTLGDGRAVLVDVKRVGGLHTGDRAQVVTLDDVVLRVDPQRM